MRSRSEAKARDARTVLPYRPHILFSVHEPLLCPDHDTHDQEPFVPLHKQNRDTTHICARRWQRYNARNPQMQEQSLPRAANAQARG